MTAIFGLKRARHFGWDHIWFECDFAYVVQLFTLHSKNVPWKFHACWLACLRFISSI